MTHPIKKSRDTPTHSRSPMQKMSFTVLVSFFPQYCAPRMTMGEMMADRIMFWINWICVARDTAAMESWVTRPSISASAAATDASIRF